MKLALRLQVDKQENHLHAQHKQDKASDEKAESVLHRYDISELNECDPIYQRINAVGSWRNVFEFFKPRCTFAQPREREENQRSACALKPKCTKAALRKVTRDVHENVRDQVRALFNTDAFRQSSRERKKVEMRFAHMKRIFKLDRLRLRGLSGARDEVLLTATAQNLRRLVKLVCRAPPLLAVACPA